MKVNIPNHYSSTLSELDLKIAKNVPPGGNWKDVPKSVPSGRIKSIRKAYEDGKGSRSTYYGRLLPDAPSYTINTYFNRPGNGCHLHYDFNQHRVLSQREAARLQTFPDNFKFYGSKTSINKQIGNAVPPILAYQIAKSLPISGGQYIDLFAGAGGLSLGFKWAGWKPIVANDIDKYSTKSYESNIHKNVILGDITEESVFREIFKEARSNLDKNLPTLVLGGPPCQGFSTAGKKRTMKDERNHLFYDFQKILEELDPDGFIFENVPGLLNMEGGKVIELIKGELKKSVDRLDVWIMKTEKYAVPQRRKRVIIVGFKNSVGRAGKPRPITRFTKQQSLVENLKPAITVREAISDLPPLEPGEDGSDKNYTNRPKNIYQKLMRGYIDVEEYISSFVSN